MTVIDFIVVGQGLAGSLLGLELIRQGKEVMIFDRPDKNISSLVAAGLYNPVTGRRFTKTWLADELFPFLTDYYHQLEQELSARFFYPKPIFRPFIDRKEQNDIAIRDHPGALGPYIDRIQYEPLESSIIRNKLGGLFLKQTGYLDLPEFLRCMRQWFDARGCLREAWFDPDKMIINDDHVIYQDIQAGKVIFCEGVSAMNTRFFSWLPFRPVKGEILFAELDELPDFIFNRQIFILPLEDNLCKVGATYDWEAINTSPSVKAKKNLESKLLPLLNVNFKIVRHIAGIRPATRDRRPLIGLHPEYNNLGIFNGLGSKGVSMAPYFARMFVNYLVNNMELIKEVHINRFK